MAGTSGRPAFKNAHRIKTCLDKPLSQADLNLRGAPRAIVNNQAWIWQGRIVFSCVYEYACKLTWRTRLNYGFEADVLDRKQMKVRTHYRITISLARRDCSQLPHLHDVDLINCLWLCSVFDIFASKCERVPKSRRRCFYIIIFKLRSFRFLAARQLLTKRTSTRARPSASYKQPLHYFSSDRFNHRFPLSVAWRIVSL